MEERVVNLWDMFWDVMSHWRGIILAIIIGALLMGGFSYFKNVKTVQNQNDTKKEIKLEPEELEKAENYINNLRLYENHKKYIENSFKMAVNAATIPTMNYSFFINNKYNQNEALSINNIQGIKSFFQEAIMNESVQSEIKEIIGDDKFPLEYITFYSNDSAQDISDGSQYVWGINIYGINEEECKGIAEIIRKIIDSKLAEGKQLFGEFEFITINENYKLISDQTVLRYQKDMLDILNALETVCVSKKKELSDNQQRYLKQNLNENSESNQQALDEKSTSLPIVSKKYIALGGMAGIFLVVLICVIGYLFNGKLRIQDGIESLFDIKLLGIISNNKQKRKWFSWIDKIILKIRNNKNQFFEEEEALDMICATIKLYFANKSNKSLFITGSYINEREKEVIDKFTSRLKKDNIEIHYSTSVCYNAEAFINMTDIGNVLFLETQGKSYYYEINKELEKSKSQNVNILGCVILE